MNEATQRPSEGVRDAAEPRQGRFERRLAAWWAGLKEESPGARPALEAIEKVVRPAWQVAQFVGALPVVLGAILAAPLLKAGELLERRGAKWRWLRWIFYVPAAVILFAALLSGWLLIGWFLWSYATEPATRKDVARILKYFAGIAIVGGAFGTADVLSWRLEQRLILWGASPRAAHWLAFASALLLFLGILAAFYHYGVLVNLEE